MKTPLSLLVLSLSLLSSTSSSVFDASARAAPLVVIEGTTAEARRLAVAERFAPTLFQETLDPLRDLVSAFDFDGDWDGANNVANVSAFPLQARVYYTVVETRTHWFVHYLPYHVVDYKRLGGHPHDTESLLLAVRKVGDRARLEVMETRFHTVWYQYASRGSDISDNGSTDDVDGPIHFEDSGRPMVHAQRAGHGLCGGLAPISWLRESELVCDHQRPPRIEAQGVIYRYTGVAEIPDARARVQTRGYALEELRTSLWAHVRDPRTCLLRGHVDYAGRCCEQGGLRCPRDLGAVLSTANRSPSSAEPPWAQTHGNGPGAIGDQFFDPARTLGRRLHFPAPYALDYEFNPYLGIEPASSS